MKSKDLLAVNFKKLENDQLKKIVGGTDPVIIPVDVTDAGVLKTKHDTAKNSVGNIR